MLGDERYVLAGAECSDAPPTESWTTKCLSSEGYHLVGRRLTANGRVSGKWGVSERKPSRP